MYDNQLIQLFLPIVSEGLVSQGFTNVTIAAAAQNFQEGVNSGPTVFFKKISDKRWGWPEIKYWWDDTAQLEKGKISQVMETTFRMQALYRQDPNNVDSITASDVLNLVAIILQSDSTVQQLALQGVGVLRIMDLPAPYFVDDLDRFESAPYFDFILTHTNYLDVVSSPITDISEGIYRV